MNEEQGKRIVHLSRVDRKPPPVRIAPHTSSPQTGGAVLLSNKQVAFDGKRTVSRATTASVRRPDLTLDGFSVTRARAHAQARASAHAYAHARKDEGALRRVLDAALSGGDVRVASVRPSSSLARTFAALLIPAMLISPLLPAYADDAPLADRVASDVAAVISSDVAAAPAPSAPAPSPEPAPSAASNVAAVAAATDAPAQSSDPAVTPATTEPAVSDSSPAPSAQSVPSTDANAPAPSAPSAVAPEATPSQQQDTASSTGSDDSTSTAPADASTSVTEVPAPTASPAPVVSSDGGSVSSSNASSNAPIPATDTESAPAGASSGGGASTPVSDAPSSDATDTVSQDEHIAAPVIENAPSGATTSTTTIVVDDSTQTDAMASTTEEGVTPIFDVGPQSVIDNVDAIRARLRTEMRGELRDEVRDEVKNEVRREVEAEVYRGCKNLDGTGYYCIPDAKSFGAPVIANERSISVVVQPDPVTGNKQIFLVRGEGTIQLTHGTDDNVFPVLDPSSDLLVWQSLQSGHWQIAYAHVNETGVPKVHYLTDSENNFNPKVAGGRIVWQAWVDGNWEIFTAIASPEKIPDDELSAEHRAVGANGDWLVKRITANNAPDMFPNVSGDTITWQAIDGGVWQVFAYDLQTGVAHRVSKPGVKSDSPQVAVVWNEEDANGATRMVGASVDGTGTFDLTALARKLVDNSRGQPKSPVSNTEIVLATPVVVRSESDATSTASTTPVAN